MIKFEFIFWCVITFAEGFARKFQLNSNKTTTIRPEWQLFEDKILSIVVISLVPAIAILLLIVCCVLIYCCCRRKSVQNLEFTPEELVKIKAQPEQLKSQGITPKTLHEHGATYEQMAKLGATPSQLVECGAEKQDLKELGATPSVLSHVGFSDRQKQRKNKEVVTSYTSDQSSSPKRTSRQSERINNKTKSITSDNNNTSQHKLMSEKPAKSRAKVNEQSIDSQADDTKTTITTSTTATALRPVKSDTFSSAMLAHGSDISTAPQPKQ